MRPFFALLIPAAIGVFLFWQWSRKEKEGKTEQEKVDTYVCTLCDETTCDCHKVEDDA